MGYGNFNRKKPSALGSSNDESWTSLKRFFVRRLKLDLVRPMTGIIGATRELGSLFSILNIF